jgi:hypothetical protein
MKVFPLIQDIPLYFLSTSPCCFNLVNSYRNLIYFVSTFLPYSERILNEQTNILCTNENSFIAEIFYESGGNGEMRHT